MRVRQIVSVLFNEPKLLKCAALRDAARRAEGFSALQRAEIAEISATAGKCSLYAIVSVLFNEPKLLKFKPDQPQPGVISVSVLFNEPKLLKCENPRFGRFLRVRFSALQRAEIAEIPEAESVESFFIGVSVLFNEPKLLKCPWPLRKWRRTTVSVLFNEPKLLKFPPRRGRGSLHKGFQCSSTSRNC